MSRILVRGGAENNDFVEKERVVVGVLLVLFIFLGQVINNIITLDFISLCELKVFLFFFPLRLKAYLIVRLTSR